ncbi:MAG TPA: hypothetical protein VGG29_03625 [Caulobacteraceae bacterium]|jgi:hypothetical protein
MADEQLHWVRFTADHDHRHGPTDHAKITAYKQGMRLRVPADCRELARKLGRAADFSPANAATAAALEADPYAADVQSPPPQPAAPAPPADTAAKPA